MLSVYGAERLVHFNDVDVFVLPHRLIYTLNEKYDTRKFVSSKKTKTSEIPVELKDLKKRFYEKISMFLLCLGMLYVSC